MHRWFFFCAGATPTFFRQLQTLIMSKHDTWVRLYPNSPLSNYLHLFPQGIPMRDPFGFEYVRDRNGELVCLWIVDLNRLTAEQADAIASEIASSFGVEASAVKQDAYENGGFAINGAWIASMACGAEGMQRTKELADFLETAPQPPSMEAMDQFLNSQQRRWIDGDETPPPLPRKLQDIDPRLVTPELESALKEIQIDEALSQYSIFDVLAGRSMVKILNDLDPENEWSIATWDDEEEDEDF